MNLNTEQVTIFKYDDWLSKTMGNRKKLTCELGAEVDGKKLSQTNAINLYLSRKLNLLGSTAEHEYEIISLISCQSDFSSLLYSISLIFGRWLPGGM